ncbi:MAG TPA: NAD(P)-dependent oxidoreductase [Candidatus Solibacter sp.]|jgi:D-3-phosphoglycerate dehydrogenase|nr:NAD(P)-dependent oxidoreductase [Candidatus Solibacter sp.]
MAIQPVLVVSTSPAPPELFGGSLPEGSQVIKASYQELLERAPEADIIVGDWSHTIHVDAPVIERAARCRLIQQPTAGYENIDVAAADAGGIPVANAGPANANAVAEHAVMSIIGCLRHLREAIADTEAGEWEQQRWLDMDLSDLEGRSVGILGFGAIGQAIARRLSGFDCTVHYHRRHRLDAAEEERLGATYVELDALVSGSEVLVLALPLTPETRGLLSADRLSAMPAGAVLVNVSRGGLVDDDALIAALEQRRLGGAALDVFTTEPLPRGHRFTGLPNVLLTPHIAGMTANSKRNILLNSISNVGRAARGEAPFWVVNNPRH